MKIEETFKKFRESYLSALSENHFPLEKGEALIQTLIELASLEASSPYLFSPYHSRLRTPFDFYQFGNDFFRPLIKIESSKVLGKEVLKEISEKTFRGENVILLANHQTEADPQVISILLEKEYPELAENMIFVAGHRVTTDPVAIPFSKGRNLLCIYSKRYIEDPPEYKEEKTLHNRRTLERMKELLIEGGKCIYVAPSGGRDRIGEDKKAWPALFDAASLELFYLISKGTKTSFYPFAMKTYEMLPPPDQVQKELGETRLAKATDVGISFGPEVVKDDISDPSLSKKERREAFSQFVWTALLEEYKKL